MSAKEERSEVMQDDHGIVDSVEPIELAEETLEVVSGGLGSTMDPDG